jgi:hypothetical protein
MGWTVELIVEALKPQHNQLDNGAMMTIMTKLLMEMVNL